MSREKEHQWALTRACEECGAVGFMATTRWCYDCWDAILTSDLADREKERLDDEDQDEGRAEAEDE